jgi:ubiquinone/menaquinone biosynthesis C-methylase UbiE
MTDDPVARWLKALEKRYLAELTVGEVGRALRALSSCYVERRSKLAAGGALEAAGKRAAFALFYGPIHLMITREIVRALGARDGITAIVDLGCGTGAAGAAWAVESGAARITGIDRHPWAVTEANRTYRHFRLRGRAIQTDVGRWRFRSNPGTAIVAAYAINELSNDFRASLLEQFLAVPRRGARVLVVEPIARRGASWWDDWRSAAEHTGGRADEWRFAAALPALQRELAQAAGLQPKELTARTLFIDRLAD